MTRTFELYLRDLTPEAQRRYRAFAEDDAGDDVSEFFPIAVLEIENEKEE